MANFLSSPLASVSAQKPFTALFAAGGTGGHLFPALAVAEQLQAASSEAGSEAGSATVSAARPVIEFIGTADKIEATIVPKHNFPFHAIPIAGLQKIVSLQTLALPFKVLRSVLLSRKILRRLQPDCVVCAGAYLSYPVGIAAAQLGIPLYLMESNAFPGKTILRLASRAQRIFLSFAESEQYFAPADRAKCAVVGNPIRADFSAMPSQASARAMFGLDPAAPTLLCFGGSLGARSINHAVEAVHPRFNAAGVQVLWQTGKNFQPAQKAQTAQTTSTTPPPDIHSEASSPSSSEAATTPAQTKQMTFIESMAAAYAAADVIVCRAGATTIAELACIPKTAIFVPLPSAANDHQNANARALAEQGAATVLADADLSSQLFDTVMELLRSPERRAQMASAFQRFAKPEAARTIARTLIADRAAKLVRGANVVSVSVLLVAAAVLCGLATVATLATPSTAFAQRSFRYDVRTGADVLAAQDFKPLSGQRVALVTNHSGRLRTLQSTLEALQITKSCTLTTLLTPEHGYYGLARAGDAVQDSSDGIRGVTQHSLYGKTRRPTRAMFDQCDVVVFDVQDTGNRSYTYLSTLFNVMDACAEFGKPLVVLDRPNPLGGKILDGAVLDTAFASFVGVVPVPLVHGCTLGELAQMINGEGWLPWTKTRADSSQTGSQNGSQNSLQAGSQAGSHGCALTVVKAEGWQRWMTWEDTDLQWTPTSPHVPSVDAVRGMAVLGFLGELGMVNVGVGYTLPFQYLGTPTLNAELLLEALRSATRRTNTGALHSITPVQTRYKPFYSKFANADCNGILLTFFPDALRFKPFSAGLEIALALRSVQPDLFAAKSIADGSRSMFVKVTGSDRLFDMLFVKKSSDEEIRRFASKGLREFGELRKKYLLYD
jgi:undecaprenyldiphospho-muramoylpentapeptide beta-N-acetylglucosaminyltransferase